MAGEDLQRCAGGHGRHEHDHRRAPGDEEAHPPVERGGQGSGIGDAERDQEAVHLDEDAHPESEHRDEDEEDRGAEENPPHVDGDDPTARGGAEGPHLRPDPANDGPNGVGHLNVINSAEYLRW